MRKLEFTTLLRRVAEGLGAELPEGMTPSTTPQRRKKNDYDHPLRRSPRGETGPPREHKVEGGSPAQLAVERASRLEAIPFDRSNYETVTEVSRLADLLEAARYQGHFAFRVKLNSSDPMQGELVGVALALVPGHAAYVPLAHRAGDGLDLGGDAIAQIPMREALDLLKPVLEDESVLKIVQNAKFDMVALARYGIALTSGRRSLPHVLRARRRPRRASARPARGASPQPYLPHRQGDHGLRPQRRRLDRVAIARATEYAGEETDIGFGSG